MINHRQVDHYEMKIEGIDRLRYAGTLVADVTIDDARCDLTINIDNGTAVFNHRWNARGVPGTFKEMLVESGSDYHYFLAKVANQTVFDAKATINEMKRRLLESRRDDYVNEDQARRVWNVLFGDGEHRASASSTRSFREFVNEMEGDYSGGDYEGFELLWNHPGDWPAVMNYPNTIEIFFEVMWPELIAELGKEIG